MNSKTVTVIIPNYNHGCFLQQRIDSVLSQSFTDFELNILDDASTDNSKEIIEKFTRLDRRISFYPSQRNSGSPFVQWNKGVRLAKADLIWIAESDDTASPDFLKTMLDIHNANPAIALAYCQSNRMTDDGTITGNWSDFTHDFDRGSFNTDFVMNGASFISDFLIHRNVIPNASAVVFKKNIYAQVQGANESLRSNSDWLTWLKMLLKHDVAFIAKPLNNFRYHAHSVIARLNTDESRNYKEQYDLAMRNEFEKYCTATSVILPVSISQQNKKYRSFDYGNKGIYQFTNGDSFNGLANLFRASFSPKPTLGYFKRLIKGDR